jgi:hypothetical protein
MDDEQVGRLEQRRMGRWRRGSMGWGRGAASPPVRRWEKTLDSEHSAGFQLARIVARVPGLRRMLGVPARLASDGDHSLEAREKRVRRVRSSLIGRLSMPAGDDRDDSRAPIASHDRPEGFPRIGPKLDYEIDAALKLLQAVPFEELQRRGWHLQPNHSNWPLNDVPFLREHPEIWFRREIPAEVNWDLDGQFRLLEQIAPFVEELHDVPEGPSMRPGELVWDNMTFPRDDVAAYYGIVRHLEPRHVVEVGAGWSSLVLARALAANDRPCDVTLVEPEPNRSVLGVLPTSWNVIESLVQFVDPTIFEALQPGDILFYDGSHCVRTGSDVNWMFFEVLPRVPPGVWIHIHDLMWPYDYSPDWVLDDGISWNEQYLVQAFLMGNTEYRVQLAMRMMSAVRRAEVATLLPKGEPGGSLWIEKLGRATG